MFAMEDVSAALHCGAPVEAIDIRSDAHNSKAEMMKAPMCCGPSKTHQMSALPGDLRRSIARKSESPRPDEGACRMQNLAAACVFWLCSSAALCVALSLRRSVFDQTLAVPRPR